MEREKNSNESSELKWNKLFNKIERALGWFFFVTGFIIIVSYTLYELLINLLKDTQLSWFVKTGIFFVIIGTVILLFSIIRERIFLSRSDKYKEINE
ncbi:MAG: hypothetical protein N3F03_04525 [Ignavibacteria bacterium]|nr:hypothetical protein [Ignavibacteria bacterium]